MGPSGAVARFFARLVIIMYFFQSFSSGVELFYQCLYICRALHKSHHEPRRGPFEKNDVFAIVNAVPAMGLCAYGFLTPTMLGGLCFGAGLGVTLFGIM